MPPEAFIIPAIYDFKLDCFSFGILILAVWNHSYIPYFPKEVKAYLPQQMREVTIRKSYFECLKEYPDLGNLAEVCLSDDKKDRPPSREILSSLNIKV